MRKIVVFVIGFIMLFTTIGYSIEKNSEYVVDISKMNQGIVSIKNEGVNDKKVKLIIEKDSKRIIYNLSGGDIVESFPLQLGSGAYKISILENVGGNKYKSVMSRNIDVEIKDEHEVFLKSIQIIEWDNSMEVIQKAKELTKDMTNDEDKISAIYQYIVNNIKYDYEKISSLSYDYLPQIDEIFEKKKGICYDYSALFAGMLRSVNVPTKLVKGYTNNVDGYHAWNEVFVNGRWIVVDTTYDAQMEQNNKEYSMEKNSKLYSKVNEY